MRRALAGTTDQARPFPVGPCPVPSRSGPRPVGRFPAYVTGRALQVSRSRLDTIRGTVSTKVLVHFIPPGDVPPPPAMPME